MKTEYAVVIITADAVRDALEETILKDLRVAVPFRILLKKYCHINQETVGVMYRKIRQKPYYSSVVRNMTLCPSNIRRQKIAPCYHAYMSCRKLCSIPGKLIPKTKKIVVKLILII